MKVLHITSHLGGGLGKALSTVNTRLPEEVEQTFLLLEEPIDKRYVSRLKLNGCPVIVSDGLYHIARLAREADIVQFEFSNHPRMLECLARTDFPAMRSVFWSHISGMSQPYIPPKLIGQSSHFIFTSRVSFRSPSMNYLSKGDLAKISVINSGFGYTTTEIGPKSDHRAAPTRIAYLGTVAFVKMHQLFFDAVDALDEHIEADIWGAVDPAVREYAETKRHPERFIFHGETQHPANAMAQADIFFYPLQPGHFGTGENALVEAMSMCLPVIVMNNPAEMEIVTNTNMGLIAGSFTECVTALEKLINLPLLRWSLGKAASQHIRTTRSPLYSARDFMTLWRGMLDEKPINSDFQSAIGNTPMEWYLSTQFLPGTAKDVIDKDAKQSTKGSFKHFEKVFVGDTSLG